jgi:hypothetical protein
MHAEEIIAWKKKLDDEEFQVREIEKKGKRNNSLKKHGSDLILDNLDKFLKKKIFR